MSVWVVVGGQYGSEGKGKISAVITVTEEIDICVRCGGPNSGHCFVDDTGAFHALRQVPTGFIRPSTRLLIPPGGLVDPSVLRAEIEALRLGPDRLGVDIRAMIIQTQDKETEQSVGLRERLSSTLCGVGAAQARRIMRGNDVVLAGAANDHDWLKPYLTNVPEELNEGIDAGKNILIEGTQGYGLSLYHTAEYPKATSRDTTAAACLSECGLSPAVVTNIVLVLRTFPIRVAGPQAGSLRDEIDWQTLQHESGYETGIAEFTTVTGMLRRVGRFDWELAARAIRVNRPTSIAVNFLDYISASNRGVSSRGALEKRTLEFLQQVEQRFHTPVQFFGTGPGIEQTFCDKLRSPEVLTCR